MSPKTRNAPPTQPLPLNWRVVRPLGTLPMPHGRHTASSLATTRELPCFGGDEARS